MTIYNLKIANPIFLGHPYMTFGVSMSLTFPLSKIEKAGNKVCNLLMLIDLLNYHLTSVLLLAFGPEQD